MASAIEVHLNYNKGLFGKKRCVRVFYDKDKRDFDIFRGCKIIHIGVDHLVFKRDRLFNILSKLVKNDIKFIVTGS